MRKSLFGHPKGSKSSRVAQPRLALAAAIARRKLAMNCSESKSGYQRAALNRAAAVSFDVPPRASLWETPVDVSSCPVRKLFCAGVFDSTQ